MTDKDFMYSEVNELLDYLGDNYINKIPQEIIDHIHQCKDDSYQNKIHDNIKDFNSIGFSKDALALIAFLNLEYWVDEETKQELWKNYNVCDLEKVALDLFIEGFHI